MRKPKQKRAVVTKQNIILAAIELFSRKGFYNTNSKQIARQAGVATGSFYAYFKNKKDVLYAAFDYYNKLIYDSIKNFNSSITYSNADPKVLLKNILENSLKAHDIFPDFHREISSVMITDQRLKKNLESYFYSGIDVAKELLLHNKDKLRIKDIDTASVLITRIIEDFVHFLVFEKPSAQHDRLLGEFVDMLYLYLFLR